MPTRRATSAGPLARALVPLLAAALFLWEGRALAQDPEVAQLRQEVAQLRTALDRLEVNLERLESRGTVPAAVQSPAAVPPQAIAVAPAPAADAPRGAGAFSARELAVLQEQARTTDALEAWRHVQAGMNLQQVRALLGAPQSVLAVGNRTGWVYKYDNAGTGSVFFSHEGIVISTMPPGRGVFGLY
jgi:hypothetical protein